jgi:catechol 2,3-dioxygenase-like lactoylglutathione lyase family enzyme
MQPRITLITLGVDDLETAVRFYRDVTGCEFSVAQELLVMAKVEGNSGIRAWCGQKNAEDSVAQHGTKCR